MRGLNDCNFNSIHPVLENAGLGGIQGQRRYRPAIRQLGDRDSLVVSSRIIF